MTALAAPPPATDARSDAVALTTAVIIHGALLAALSLTVLAAPEPLRPPSDPVTVMLSDEIGLESGAPILAEAPTSLAPELGEPDPKPVEAVEAPAVTPPAPPARTERERPTRQAAPQTRERPAPAREEPRRRRGSRLSDNLLEGISENPSTSRQANAAPADAITPQVQASLQQAVTRQLRPHWTPPSGADAERLRTTVRFRLNSSGGLIGAPQVISTSGETASNRPQIAVHQRRAVAAVRAAAPFDLPERYYEAWEVIEYDFRADI